jgi:hypothetical protein
MAKITAAFLGALTVLLGHGATGTTTWYVDQSVIRSGNGKSWSTAFKWIQKGIDSASEGDTVVVAKGTCYENIQFKGENIVLTSTDPDDPWVVALTIIDGSSAGPVVMFSGSEDETAVLCGFTIRNGSVWGGIIGGRSRATIRNNLITGNVGADGGGVSYCNGTIHDNYISGNSAEYGGGIGVCHGIIRSNTISGNTTIHGGGGLYLCNGTVQDNVISDNSSVWNGGGLHECDGTITGNLITDNSVTGQDGQGGGLSFCDGSILSNTISGNSSVYLGGGLCLCGGIIRGNVISGNRSEDAGGGLAFCGGTIDRNIITANWAHNEGGGVYGGGVYGDVFSNLIAGNSCWRGGGLARCYGDIVNNTIVANAATDAGGGLRMCSGLVQNCIIWGNTALHGAPQLEQSQPAFCCIQDWVGGGDGNISSNPWFVDADGPDNDPETYDDNNYRLLSFLGIVSPCIDSGKNEPWMWTARDLDGNNRIVPGTSSATVDMGAYEHRSFRFEIVKVERTLSDGGKPHLTWNSRPGDTYVVWSRPFFPTGMSILPWTEEATVPSEGHTTSWIDPLFTAQKKFYRVELKP